jgi:hypothetical protein
VLRIGQKETFLSTQSFAEEAAEDGWKNLSSFTYQYTPCWRYHVGGVMVERKLALGWEENTAAALYTVENRPALYTRDRAAAEVRPQRGRAEKAGQDLPL